MKKKLRKVMIVVLAALMLTGGSLLIRQLVDNRKAANLYADAQSIADFTTEPRQIPSSPIPSDMVTAQDCDEESVAEDPMDDYALRMNGWNKEAFLNINPDVIGWIWIPGTEISYPLLHTTDNETYLYTAWDGSKNKTGSIFLETRSDPNFEDFHTIIYGHNMRSGAMFAALHGYKEADFWNTHPYVYVVTTTHVYRYAVFSGYEAPVTSDTYRLFFKDDAQKQKALRFYMDSSVHDSGMEPTVSDHILTLSTCTGTGTYESRWVVQAMRTGCWEKENVGLTEKTDGQDMFTVEDASAET